MKRIKAYFLTRMLREKVLLLGLAFALLAVWGSSVVERGRRSVREIRTLAAEKAEQELWLSRRQAIEEAAKRSIGRLEPGRTLDGTKLLAEVGRIAAESGLTSNTSVEDTRNEPEPSGQFTVHSLSFTVRKAEFGTLVKFYAELQKRSPYIGLEKCSIQADRVNPAQLNAALKLTSVEVRQ